MSTKFTTNSLATADHRSRLVEVVGDENVFINTSLAEVGRLGLGGVAELYARAKTSQQLVELARAAIEMKIPYQLVAAGTGSLPSDVGFPGLIIENLASSFFFSEESRQVIVDSGVNNAELVMAAANQNLGGIEYLVTIPGSVGGAIATSAAYADKTIRNQNLKEIVVFIPNVNGGDVVTIPSGEIIDQPYLRLFSESEGFQPIILTARLQLARLSQYEIMGRLKELRRVIRRHNTHTLGCFFQPTISNLNYKIQLPEIPDGVNYSLKQPNEISLQSGKGLIAADVRRFIDNLRQAYHQSGTPLDVRLTYLGYWPKDNETNSTNTESF